MAAVYQLKLQQGGLQFPSESVLSRARLKLDVALALREQAGFRMPDEHFVYLSVDSSPQNGLDWLMTLQDVVRRSDAGKLMLLLEKRDQLGPLDPDEGESELDQFLQSGFLKTSALPIGIVGSGKSDLASKFECLFHCIKLQVGTQARAPKRVDLAFAGDDSGSRRQ